MFDSKKDALIAEGLSPGEADYLLSGGSNTAGLELPDSADDASAASTTVEHAPRRERQEGTDLAGQDAELRDLREKHARLDERMRIFREAAEQPEAQAQPKQRPDRESQPFEYMAWLEDRIEGLQQSSERTRAEQQENAAYVALHDAYTTDARTFARTNADFARAYNYLMANRDAELVAAGYTDPAYRRQVILSDERDLVARALHARQTNPNAAGPAQLIYAMAKARGFTGGPVPQRGSSQRGSSAAQSGGFDLERLSALTDSQYAAWKRSLSPQQRKSYSIALGGA